MHHSIPSTPMGRSFFGFPPQIKNPNSTSGVPWEGTEPGPNHGFLYYLLRLTEVGLAVN